MMPARKAKNIARAAVLEAITGWVEKQMTEPLAHSSDRTGEQ
jgi:hypothetical protein